jgi:hypothetical protein
VWPRTLRRHEITRPPDKRANREQITLALRIVRYATTDDDDRDTGDRHQGPDHGPWLNSLVEHRTRDYQQQGGLQRADDRNDGNARELDGAEEQRHVGAEKQPAQERESQQMPGDSSATCQHDAD